MPPFSLACAAGSQYLRNSAGFWAGATPKHVISGSCLPNGRIWVSLDGVLAAKLNWSANAPDSETTSGELRSLEGLHNSVALPPATAGFWKQWRAFTGPAFLISVGYMDPGNWGTDLQAGASYKYGLLWVVGSQA